MLVVECLGASTVALYGINLLWDPLYERFIEDHRQPGTPKVDLPWAYFEALSKLEQGRLIRHRSIAFNLLSSSYENHMVFIWLRFCPKRHNDFRNDWTIILVLSLSPCKVRSCVKVVKAQIGGSGKTCWDTAFDKFFPRKRNIWEYKFSHNHECRLCELCHDSTGVSAICTSGGHSLLQGRPGLSITPSILLSLSIYCNLSCDKPVHCLNMPSCQGICFFLWPELYFMERSSLLCPVVTMCHSLVGKFSDQKLSVEQHLFALAHLSFVGVHSIDCASSCHCHPPIWMLKNDLSLWWWEGQREARVDKIFGQWLCVCVRKD